MKKLFLLLFCSLLGTTLFAQLPTYYNNNTAAPSNAYPWATTAGKGVQNIFQPNTLTGAYNGLITDVYYKVTPNITTTYTDLTIQLGQTSSTTLAPAAITDATTSPSVTFVTVYYASSVTLTSNANGWLKVTLQTPFLYDPNLSLISYVFNCSASNTSMSTCNFSATSPCRTYINNSGCAPVYSGQDGNTCCFGVDMMPNGPCTSPPTAGTSTASAAIACVGGSVTLNLNGNSMGMGQTYQWQRGTTATGPWTNVGSPGATPFYNATIPAVGANYYRCAVTCASSTAYSTPVLVNGNANMAAGTYTINNTVPTGGTNFNSFADAIAALECGVAGPVVFNVSPGTYNERLLLPNIPGTSNTNRIRFNGNGALLQASMTTTYDAMLEMDGTKYVTIDSLKFKSLSTAYGFGANIYNNCDRDSVMRCEFDLTAVTTSSSTSCQMLRVGSAKTSVSTTASGATNSFFGYNDFKGNTTTLYGAYYGAYLYGPNNNNVYHGNKFSDYYYYGFYCYYASNPTISDNIVTREGKAPSTSGGLYGMYLNYLGYNGTGAKVTGNRIYRLGGSGTTTAYYTYPMYVGQSQGTAANPILIANNAIYNPRRVVYYGGIYLTGGSYVNVYHNTINIEDLVSYSTTTIQSGIYLTTTTNCNIVNNNISYTGGGPNTKYGIYLNAAPASCDYNNIYMNSTATGTQYYGYSGGAHSTHAAFQAATVFQTSGLSTDPQFVNAAAGDLTPGSSTALVGAGSNLLSIVPLDINGLPRAGASTPGAFEVPLPPCTSPPTAGNALVNSPVACEGGTISIGLDGNSIGSSQTYQWQYANSATGPWTNLGSSQLGSTYSGPVPGSGKKFFRCGVTCSLTSTTYSTVDSIELTPQLNGYYTINDAQPTAGTNYNSFGDAVQALGCGVSGPVTFEVVAGSGPYNEKLVLGSIAGTSNTNRVRFVGNGCQLEYSPGGTYEGLLEMGGTAYVTIDSLTFKSTNATYGFGAILHSQCDYDSVMRCTFDLTDVNSTSSANSTGLRITATANGTSTTASGATNTFFGYNKILGYTATQVGMYYGAYIYGPNDNNVYHGNLISDYYYYGMYCYYAQNPTISDNRITRENKTTASIGYYGLYAYYSGYNGTGARITGNRIYRLGGSTSNNSYCYPMYVYYPQGTVTKPIIVANNAIYDMTSSPTYGINAYYGQYAHYYHNTIDIANPITYTGNNYGIYLYNQNNATLKNNNISITGGGTGIKIAWYLYTAPQVMDYNNAYVNSSQTGAQYYSYYNSTNYNTLANFQAASTYEVNGMDVDPQFGSAASEDFTPDNSALHGAGDNVYTMVPDDIIGYQRYPQPTLGAWEIWGEDGQANGVISPSGYFCANEQNVEIEIENPGKRAISNFQIGWSVNGIPQTPATYIGTLDTVGGAGKNKDTVMIGSAVMNVGANVIRAWVIVDYDLNQNNDTLTGTVTPTVFSATVVADTVCKNGEACFNLTPGGIYPDGWLTWSSSPDGTTWTNLPNSDDASFCTSPVTASGFYRAHINSGVGGCYTNNVSVHVPEPEITSTTGAGRCGTGTVQLMASGNAQMVRWYTVPTGGAPIGTGSPFTTPVVSTTTTFYAEPVIKGCVGPRVPVEVVVTPTYVVDLGADTVICTPSGMANLWLDAGHTDATYLWDDNSVNKTRMVNATGVYYVTVSRGFCDISDTIEVIISQNPIVNLGSDIAICGGTTHTLNAGNPGSYYLWDDNSTAQTRVVGSSGTYFVTVTNPVGCVGSDTINFTIKPTPSVDLGNDTTICGLTTIVLDAGNPGFTYLWDDYGTSQKRVISSFGTYYVAVTNGASGCIDRDTITISPAMPLAVGYFTTTPLGGNTYQFTVIAANYSNLTWDFGDGSPLGTGNPITHTYMQPGTYEVKLAMYNDCKDSVQRRAIIRTTSTTGIDEVKVDGLNVYPNPAQDWITVENQGEDKIQKIYLFTMTGAKVAEIDTDEMHQTVKVQVTGFADGLYMLYIQTNNGMIQRKVNVRR